MSRATIQEWDEILLTMALTPTNPQSQQHGASNSLSFCGSIAGNIDDSADLPKAWRMPYTGMRVPARSVSHYSLLPRIATFAHRHARTDFLAGQFFDIRLEVHAPVNGSEANGGIPDSNFTLTVSKDGDTRNAAAFFGMSEPSVERWNFTWYEGIQPTKRRTTKVIC